MAVVRMSKAAVRALGIGGPPADATATATAAPQPARRRPRGERLPAAVSICHDCGLRLEGEAAATRHVAPGHLRYETPIDEPGPIPRR